MPRSDVKPLSFMELESFLENVTANKPQTPAEAAAPEQEKPAPAVKPLEYCPHCNSKLSALDNKFGQCMACHKPLRPPNPADSQPDTTPVSIGI